MGFFKKISFFKAIYNLYKAAKPAVEKLVIAYKEMDPEKKKKLEKAIGELAKKAYEEYKK